MSDILSSTSNIILCFRRQARIVHQPTSSLSSCTIHFNMSMHICIRSIYLTWAFPLENTEESHVCNIHTLRNGSTKRSGNGLIQGHRVIPCCKRMRTGESRFSLVKHFKILVDHTNASPEAASGVQLSNFCPRHHRPGLPPPFRDLSHRISICPPNSPLTPARAGFHTAVPI
jgi:hypothetical protein